MPAEERRPGREKRSGLGGGAFLLHFDRAEDQTTFLDGRESAPASATPDLFMTEDGVMGYLDAWQSGKAVGTPGTVALYYAAHQRAGRLPWATLFQPALKLASDGFIVSPRLANYLPMMAKRSRLAVNVGSAAYFYPNGEALKAGARLKNPEYAATLTAIAEGGPDAFYTGDIAEAIVAGAARAPNPGSLSLDDLKNYQVKERPVICGPYRVFKICTTAPPSSGELVRPAPKSGQGAEPAPTGAREASEASGEGGNIHDGSFVGFVLPDVAGLGQRLWARGEAVEPPAGIFWPR